MRIIGKITLTRLATVAVFWSAIALPHSVVSAATVWTIYPDGSGDAPTIQAAINSSANGDTVLVTDGFYTGDGNRDLDLSGKLIVVRSVNGPASTTIDATETPLTHVKHRGFIFQSGENSQCVVDGFTIADAFATNLAENNGERSGGAILILNSSPTIRNCIATRCDAIWGAAVYCYRSSAAFFNCTFVGNLAVNGTGVVADSLSSVTMANCIIASSAPGSAVVCLRASTVSMTCSNVYGNTGGDWTGCLAGQNGTGGNFSSRPFFCDSAAGDFHLFDVSPCVPTGNSCAILIGALGQACIYCTVDTDGDGFGDPGNPVNFCPDDNCPVNFNPDQTDADLDGWGAACDCNDTDSLLNPNTPWYEDADSDSYGNILSFMRQCEQPAGYVRDSTDCDDSDPDLNPNTVWHRDNDQDGYGHMTIIVRQCTQPLNYVRDSTDCQDWDPELNPETRWFGDADADGFGDTAVVMTQCEQPTGFVRDSTDNCPILPNSGQEDGDADGYGDVCDNCAFIFNPGQEDADGDAVGDVCDKCPAGDDNQDTDGDLVPDSCDVCPTVFDAFQQDSDSDGIGDACDNCPTVFNPDQADTNGNNVGDVCDCACPNQGDMDANGFIDSVDLSEEIDAVFFGGSDLQDPDCPTTRGDFDNNGFTDSVDLSKIIDHVFFGGPGSDNPCGP